MTSAAVHVVVAAFIIVAVSGAKVYVDPAVGNTSPCGTTRGLACGSLLDAYTSSVDFDEIVLSPGLHQVWNTITWAKTLAVTGDPAGTTVACGLLRPNTPIAYTQNSGVFMNFTSISFRNCSQVLELTPEVAPASSAEFTSCNFGGTLQAAAVVGGIGAITFDGCTFADASHNADIIVALQAATVTLRGCVVDNNLISSAQFVNLKGSSTARVQGTTARGNRWGSFVYATSSSRLWLNDTVFTSNYGSTAAVVGVRSKAKVVMDNVTITYSTGASSIGASVQFPPGGAGDDFLFITNSRFEHNKVSAKAGGGVMDLTASVSSLYTQAPDATIHVDHSTFNDNYGGTEGGAVRQYEVHSTFSWCYFTNNHAAKGGGLSMDEGGEMDFNYCVVEGNVATTSGGGMSLDDPFDALSGTFVVIGGSIRNNKARTGGAFAITAVVRGLALRFEGVTISGNEATQEGGGFWFQDQYEADAVFKDCVFKHQWAPVGGAIMQGGSFAATYEHCDFADNTADFGGVIATAASAKAAFVDSFFHNNSAANEGGVSYAKTKSVIALTSCNVTTNRATRGGAFFGQDDTNTTLDFCNVDNNQADNGAVTYLLGDITANGRPFFLIADSNFTNNRADFGAVTYAAVATFSTTDRCRFTDNTATASGGVMYLSGRSVSTFAESFAARNHAGFDGGIVYISDDTHMSVWRSWFVDSTSLRGGAFFATDESGFVIDNSDITRNTGTMGGAIHLDGVPYSSINAAMTVTNSRIYSNTGTTNAVGGAAFASGSTRLFARYCNFTMNYAQFGGAVYGRDDATVLIQDSIVEQNHAATGGALYTDLRCHATLTGSRVANNSADNLGGVAYLGAESRVIVEYCQVLNNRAVTGGVVSSTGNAIATLKGCTAASNFASRIGGVFYSTGDVASDTVAGVVCQDTTLIDNSATVSGGAAYIMEAASVDSTGCTYIGNSATTGGAILAEQRLVYTQEDGTKVNACLSFKFVNNTFKNNHAKEAGGVLAWNFNDDQTYSPCPFCEDDCFFSGNTAVDYRPITSTPLVATIFVSSGHWHQKSVTQQVDDVQVVEVYSNATFTETVHTYTDCDQTKVTSVFPTITSGQDITPSLVISGKDFYGQPFDDPKLRASLVVSAAPNDPLAAAGGSTVADSVTGEAEFGNLFFVAKPGSTQKVTFSVLEPTQIEPLEMYVRMRNCYMGEVEPEGQNECVECPPGKYSWDPTSSQCLDCPINALCQGGASMWPLAGYWRSSNTSIEFHKCPLAEACLGAPISNDVLFKPNGDRRHDFPEQCEEGYMGRLCHRCAPGYGRSGQNGCAKCPDRVFNLLLITGGAVAAFLIMGFLIYTTRKSAKNDKDLMMMMIKIFMSYIQFVSLAVGLEIDWPPALVSLFRAQQGASSVTELFISFDCALASPDGDPSSTGQAASSGGIELFYQTQILYFFLPFLGIGFICAFWAGMYVFRLFIRKYEVRRSADLKKIMTENAIVSTLVLLFFMHPTLTTRTFMMFACTEIDSGKFFLSQDLDIPCYDVAHTLWIAVLGLPAVILFVIGIPGGAFFVLYRRRHLLRDPDPEVRYHVKVKFGFLYAGFEIPFYYWECVIMLRKVLVISIVVFFSQFGALVQTGAALGLVYLAYNAHLWAMPYEDDVLDDLEKYSLLTSLCTFFAGVFLNAPTMTAGWALFLVALIFCVQVAYILFFVNVIKGEVLKKVREVREKVKETTKLVAQNTNKKRGAGKRQLTDAEKKEEQEYLERMREKENMAASRRDRVQKAKRKRQKKSLGGSIFGLFGGGKKKPPRRRLNRGTPDEVKASPPDDSVDVGNPLNRLDEEEAPVVLYDPQGSARGGDSDGDSHPGAGSGSGAGAGAGAGSGAGVTQEAAAVKSTKKAKKKKKKKKKKDRSTPSPAPVTTTVDIQL